MATQASAAVAPLMPFPEIPGRWGDFLVSPGLGAAAGLAASLIAWVSRGRRFGQWSPHPASILLSFVGCAGAPVGVALICYPFFDKPPDLKGVMVYVPVAGLSLIYATVVAFKQGAAEDPDPPQPNGGSKPSDPPRPATPPSG